MRGLWSAHAGAVPAHPGPAGVLPGLLPADPLPQLTPPPGLGRAEPRPGKKQGMFTGIVQSVGQVVEGRTGHLAIRSDLVREMELGGSIAVNGVCPTAVELEGDVVSTDVVPETRRRSNLGLLRPGDAVNMALPTPLAQSPLLHLS